jgi:hypothetical protein
MKTPPHGTLGELHRDAISEAHTDSGSNVEHEPSVRFPDLKASSPMAFFSRANFNLLSVVEGSADIVPSEREDYLCKGGE